jgi:hypothetical protein
MLAVAGLVLVHTRNFDRGAAVARRALELIHIMRAGFISL